MKAIRWLPPLSLVLMFLSLSIGASSQFSWLKLFQGEEVAYQVFFESRLPRTLAIVLAAGAMSLSGLLMQTITQNNYAAPSTVGTVEAAQLGMLISLFFSKSKLSSKNEFCLYLFNVNDFIFYQSR